MTVNHFITLRYIKKQMQTIKLSFALQNLNKQAHYDASDNIIQNKYKMYFLNQYFIGEVF